MRKVRENNLLINIGRIRRRRDIIKEGRDSNLLSTKIVLIQINKIDMLSFFIIARAWICIQGNTGISTNEGYIFIYQFNTRSFQGVKDFLPNEYTRIKRITNATRKIVEERVHMPKCFTLGSASTLCEKEEWSIEDVYWL